MKRVNTLDELMKIIEREELNIIEKLINSPSLLDRLAGLGAIEIYGYVLDESIIRQVLQPVVCPEQNRGDKNGKGDGD